MIDIKLADLNLATGPFLALLKTLAIGNEEASRGDTRPAKTAANLQRLLERRLLGA